MKLDLDAIDTECTMAETDREYRFVGLSPDEARALVRITRAAVAWRDNAPQSGTLNALLDAMREAGL